MAAARSQRLQHNGPNPCRKYRENHRNGRVGTGHLHGRSEKLWDERKDFEKKGLTWTGRMVKLQDLDQKKKKSQWDQIQRERLCWTEEQRKCTKGEVAEIMAEKHSHRHTNPFILRKQDNVV